MVGGEKERERKEREKERERKRKGEGGREKEREEPDHRTRWLGRHDTQVSGVALRLVHLPPVAPLPLRRGLSRQVGRPTARQPAEKGNQSHGEVPRAACEQGGGSRAKWWWTKGNRWWWYAERGDGGGDRCG